MNRKRLVLIKKHLEKLISEMETTQMIEFEKITDLKEIRIKIGLMISDLDIK